MDTLQVLEQKVAMLIDLVKQLKSENSLLLLEKNGLQKKLEDLELAMLDSKDSVSLEKELTKEVIDEIIKSIDTFVGNEGQL